MRFAVPVFRCLMILACCSGLIPPAARAQDDGGMASSDGGGQEVLQSLYLPSLPNAPFSLVLGAEWVRPLANGGTFTVVNSRPIKRDSAGRIYQERWLLSPKGSGIPSEMSWIQIEDPVAHIYYECNARRHVCDLKDLPGSPIRRYSPERFKSGPLQNGKGTFTHEDLGAQSFAGLPVHGYRDTTTLNAGVLGNDLPMATVREFRYSAELGINLTSTLQSPHVGRQIFTASEVSTAEPDASFFQPPAGYTVVDGRKGRPSTP